MQQAVLHHFPEAQTTYKFFHRDANIYFTRQCYEQFVATIPCAHTFPLLLLFLPVDILEARVLHLISDTRGTHLAAKYMPLFQAFIPRLPCRLSLQAVPGPGILRSACARQRRRPHRDRSVRSLGRGDLLGSATFGHSKRDLFYDSR
jgi:hypothetical protein